MPPRSLVASSRRPLSAIFLGSLPPPKDPKEANIPDLPEPPDSPTAVSPSGLPSPPATNSTGSGSTGDNNSANSGSLRQRPASYSSPSSATMSSATHEKSISFSKTSRPNSDDEDDENDYANEEDNTARLDRRLGSKNPSENIAALQRVKSLAQRNRMALDKLSSRLNTPSPSHSSRSPLPPLPSSSSSTTSSSRHSSHSHSNSAPQFQPNDTLSGSETERESLRAPTPSRSDSNSNSYRSHSPELSTTPPSVSSSRQQRRLSSAPTSPEKTRKASPGPSRTPRKRVSMAGAVSFSGAESGRYGKNDRDVTDAALAAVASSRRSPTNRRPRQPLPREFRGGERWSLDGRESVEPMTPHRTSFHDDVYDDDNVPRTAATTTAQFSPRGARSTRFSTVRDLTRRHQTRWLSDDISNNPQDGGRKQSQRGGSAESALNGGGAAGRLASEGLRAAGIGMRGSVRHSAPPTEDVFVDEHDVDVSVRRARSSAASSRTGCTVEWEEEERHRRSDTDGRSQTSGSSARISEGVGPPAPRPHLHSDPSRTQASLIAERDARGSSRIISSRPATSMADFYHGENGARNGTYSIRSRRTHDPSDRHSPRESPTQRSVPLPQTPAEPERSRTGTLARRRSIVTPPGNAPSTSTSSSHSQSAEHTRLMMESLSMFHAQLSRLPSQSQTVRDLSEHSGTIIRASERLNAILRSATNNAVQQQIAIEVDDEYYESDTPDHPAQIWRDVGSDFRESLRESDNIVRSLTGFILGVGKLLKETGAPDSGHLRTMSLDEDIARMPPPDLGLERGSGSSRRSQDGRRSVESRLSWEPLTSGGDLARRISSRGDHSLARPSSASRDRDRDSASDQDRSNPSRNSMNAPPLSATRRLFTPREQREQQLAASASTVQSTPGNIFDLSANYEPSPTPTSRYPQAERSRPPAYSTPPPLPTLPSESILQRSSTASTSITSTDKSTRRQASMASITTIRAPNAPFSLSTPNPTTAITTHTVTASPDVSTFPLERTESRDSVRSSVTFSRPSGISVSTLQQQQSRDDARRRVTTSTNVEGEPSGLNQMRSPLSGSETERDTRRRTIGVRTTRLSLQGPAEENEAEGGNGNGQPRTITFPSQRRERRRTVTEIFG